jgi:hypothetical protein
MDSMGMHSAALPRPPRPFTGTFTLVSSFKKRLTKSLKLENCTPEEIDILFRHYAMFCRTLPYMQAPGRGTSEKEIRQGLFRIK